VTGKWTRSVTTARSVHGVSSKRAGAQALKTQCVLSAPHVRGDCTDQMDATKIAIPSAAIALRARLAPSDREVV